MIAGFGRSGGARGGRMGGAIDCEGVDRDDLNGWMMISRFTSFDGELGWAVVLALLLWFWTHLSAPVYACSFFSGLIDIVTLLYLLYTMRERTLENEALFSLL